LKFTEAFEALGYSLSAPRTDWSAQSSTGVCVSLWKKEMGIRDGLLWMNTRVHATPLENWRTKAGNQKRTQHLRQALHHHDGRVDVVIVSGSPGDSYGSAQPWVAEGARAGTCWQVTELDDATGHFEVVLRRS
jgi:hypothetical protein